MYPYIPSRVHEIVAVSHAQFSSPIVCSWKCAGVSRWNAASQLGPAHFALLPLPLFEPQVKLLYVFHVCIVSGCLELNVAAFLL
jgi:hypothetical protein